MRVRVCVRIRLKSNVTNMSNEIKDFRRKQGDLEFFFLCLVRADNREKFDYLLRYGRTLQLGGEKYARVDEIDLESDIADNADKLDVVMLQVRDDLKSPARIDVFKLPNIKRMLDNGIVSSREVAVLLGVCDSLVSIMTDNKELFKSLVKKYTKQDDSGTSDKNIQKGWSQDLINLFNGHSDLIDDVAMLDSDDDKLEMICRMSKQRYSAEDRTMKCKLPFDRLQMAWARALIDNKIISAKSAESLSKRFNKFKQ